MNQRTTIGRDSINQIIIGDFSSKVSRNHATIHFDGHRIVFEDHSSNGTIINGRNVFRSSIEIRESDEILLGGEVRLPWSRIMPFLTNYNPMKETTKNRNDGHGQQIIINNQVPQQQSNGIGTAGFVLAVITVFLGWIPVLGWILWFLGLVFSFAGLFKNPRGLAIAGFTLSMIGLILLTACLHCAS